MHGTDVRLPALRVRGQAFARELYTLRVREDRATEMGVRRSLKGRRHA